MKTIKIIDLLNKIANGEKVPKKIKIEGIEYKIVNPAYPHMYKDYSGNELEDNIHYITRFLDKEVEIIEEEKEIEKIKSNGDEFYSEYINAWIKKEETEAYCEYLMNKVNELIDIVNELKGKSE